MHWTLMKGKMELSKHCIIYSVGISNISTHQTLSADRTLEGKCISNSEQNRSVTYRIDHNIWNTYFNKVPATDFNIDSLLHMLIIYFYSVSLKKGLVISFSE